MKNKISINENMIIQTSQAIKSLAEVQINQQSQNHLDANTIQLELMTGAYVKKYAELKKNETELINSIGDALFEMQQFIVQATKDIKALDKKYALRKINRRII